MGALCPQSRLTAHPGDRAGPRRASVRLRRRCCCGLPARYHRQVRCGRVRAVQTAAHALAAARQALPWASLMLSEAGIGEPSRRGVGDQAVRCAQRVLLRGGAALLAAMGRASGRRSSPSLARSTSSTDASPAPLPRRPKNISRIEGVRRAARERRGRGSSEARDREAGAAAAGCFDRNAAARVRRHPALLAPRRSNRACRGKKADAQAQRHWPRPSPGTDAPGLISSAVIGTMLGTSRGANYSRAQTNADTAQARLMRQMRRYLLSFLGRSITTRRRRRHMQVRRLAEEERRRSNTRNGGSRQRRRTSRTDATGPGKQDAAHPVRSRRPAGASRGNFVARADLEQLQRSLLGDHRWGAATDAEAPGSGRSRWF